MCRALFVLVAMSLGACASSPNSTARRYGANTRGLLDSLSRHALSCPQGLPKVVTYPPGWTEHDICSVVQAAKRRLGRDKMNLPLWAPQDSGHIAAVGIHLWTALMADTTGAGPLDSLTGFHLARADSLLTVELDVPGRPFLLRVTYDRVRHTETLGVVHRPLADAPPNTRMQLPGAEYSALRSDANRRSRTADRRIRMGGHAARS
jgi:hypothetical protein